MFSADFQIAEGIRVRARRHGDLMRLKKSRPKSRPNPFLVKNFKHNFDQGKSSPIICAISAVFAKLPKVLSRPIGENSPNLVTLLGVNIKNDRGKKFG
jgi:hypothetical protein